MHQLTPPDLERLAALLGERSGMAFPRPRWVFLGARATELITKSGFASVRRWLQELEASAAKRGNLYCEFEDALQIHETGFFRYPDHHRILADVLRPLCRIGGPRVRIVSVGCATGEEAYSIAMTVREAVPRVAASTVEIVALDVSRRALVAAVRGTYPPARLGDVPPEHLAKYFVPGPEGFAVVPSLREMIRFRQHDIRRGFYLGKFDVIFACNVLLYFTPETREEILTRLADSLAPGGYLFLGHAEGVTPPAARFEAREAGGFVYRRNAERLGAREGAARPDLGAPAAPTREPAGLPAVLAESVRDAG